MPLVDGFPSVSGAADQFEIRKDLAGLVARNAAGQPRTGVFYTKNASLITARADMSVDVSAFQGISTRSTTPYGVVFNANDGTTTVGPFAAAPASGSRIDVIYFKQNETQAPSSDATDGPVFGIVSGTAAAVPTKPALTVDGAVEVGTVQIPSTATATNSAGVVITTTAQWTATSGAVMPCRNASELAAWTPGDGNLAKTLDDGALWHRISGDWSRLHAPGAAPFAMSSGSGTNPAGSMLTVSFPAGRFTVAPIVTATCRDTSIAFISVSNVTTTSFRIGGYSSAGTLQPTNWYWTAVQMTATAAAG